MGEEDMFGFVIWCAFIAMCYLIAEKNGRDTRWAVVWGVLFGCFAALVYLVIGAPSTGKTNGNP